MRILLFTRFYPNIGGIETVAGILAAEWSKAGHLVTIATDVAEDLSARCEFPFRVVYRPSIPQLLTLVTNCDVYAQFNIRLKSIFPALFCPSKFVATHHGFYCIDAVGNRDWRERLKLRITRRVANIAVSNAVATEIDGHCHVIPNPYDNSVFRNLNAKRTGDLVFVGRLVSEKGVDISFRAIAALKQKLFFTVIGDGPERRNLEALAAELGIASRVTFTGALLPKAVAQLLNEHKVLVVPSRCREGFGVAAVEGIACGCAVIGAASGGLPEAIGACGLTFPNGDSEALARCIQQLLTNSAELDELRSHGPSHVAKHEPGTVARAYLRFFEEVVAGNYVAARSPRPRGAA